MSCHRGGHRESMLCMQSGTDTECYDSSPRDLRLSHNISAQHSGHERQ